MVTRQHDRGQPEQRQGEDGTASGVEGRLILIQDRRGEGREADQREHPELREQVQRDEQRTPEHRGTHLRDHDPPEGAPRPEAQGARAVLPGAVQPAQQRRDRQEDEGGVGQGRDQGGPGKPGQRRPQGDPGIGIDEGRHGQRRHERDPPPAGARQGGALDEPGGADAEHHARGGGDHDERGGVAQQFTDAGTQELGQCLARPGIERGGENDAQGQHADRRDDHGDRRDGRQGTGPVPRAGAQRHGVSVTESRPPSSRR